MYVNRFKKKVRHLRSGLQISTFQIEGFLYIAVASYNLSSRKLSVLGLLGIRVPKRGNLFL